MLVFAVPQLLPNAWDIKSAPIIVSPMGVYLDSVKIAASAVASVKNKATKFIPIAMR